MCNELEGDTDGKIFKAIQINRRQKAKLRKENKIQLNNCKCCTDMPFYTKKIWNFV